MKLGTRTEASAKRLRRGEKYLDALGAEHRVKHAGVRGVPIPNQEPELTAPLPNLSH
jgi:hypothetical protein